MTTRADLAAVMRRPGPWRVAFVTDGSLPAEFEFWTRCVFAALETGGPLAAVAEELADVSTPAKAPPGWGLLVRRSKKRGVQLYAISQRWAEADKTILGNADEWVLFSQASLDDVRYLARKSRLEFDTLAALRPFEFVRYDCGAKQICEAAKVRKRR